MDRFTASCAIEIAQGAQEWVQLMPLGLVATRPHDGRAPWRLDDAAGVVAATRALGLDLAVDYEHQTQLAAKNGQPAPAAGWIKELQVRDDGIYGRVEWTARAAAMLAAREYRFISPTFEFDPKTRAVKRILGAGLTNDPALFIKAVAKREDGAKHEDHMDKLIEQLRTLLGLAPGADEAAVAAAVKTAIEDNAAAQTGLATVARAAGLTEKTAAGEIATAVASAIAAGKPDPSKFVPIADYQALARRVETIEAAGLAEKATAAVEAAIRAGKLLPAQRDWAVDFAGTDLAKFATFVDKQPVIVKPGAATASARPGGGETLDEDDIAVARALGLSPEAFKKSRDEEGRA